MDPRNPKSMVYTHLRRSKTFGPKEGQNIATIISKNENTAEFQKLFYISAVKVCLLVCSHVG